MFLEMAAKQLAPNVMRIAFRDRVKLDHNHGYK